jgi:hypothetical protein
MKIIVCKIMTATSARHDDAISITISASSATNAVDT